MNTKVSKILNKIKKYFLSYVATNRLFLFFVFSSLISCILVRSYTVANALSFKPLIVDLALILFIASFCYLLKPKNQFMYLFIWSITIAILNIVNSVYFVFYQDFASFGLLDTLGQLGEVGTSVTDKFEVRQFIYILGPLLLYLFYYGLNKTNYFHLVTKIEKGKKMFVTTLLATAFLAAITIVSMQNSDYSRLTKQWNRNYIVERFGIILYQCNDLIQTIRPKFNTLFGYEQAMNNYRLFYQNKALEETKKNKYTNKFKDYDVVFVHLESIQTFLMDLSFNGTEVTPNLNKLAKEGMFFKNFYPQISTGTSSDTEFSLLTSLMPAQSGTVFVSYYDRQYTSIVEMLNNQDYYTFSMHGNKGSMWNRERMHTKLGYQEMFFESKYDINDVVGLGISDLSFFQQTIPMLETIEEQNKKYMGTIITLSNHSPFLDGAKLGDLNLTYTINYDELGNLLEEPEVDNYLEKTKLGYYLESVHYSDYALGEFINMIQSSDKFSKTLFVFYGDHDAKLSRSEFDYLYNYKPELGRKLKEDEEGYINYDYYAHELNKKTPLIFWTKNGAIKGQIDYYMGMIDIEPTIGNMMGFSSKYALGYDIFNKKNDNIVIFPNGNFLTSKVYYNNSKEQYIAMTDEPIEEDYIKVCKEYTDARLKVSNDIIVHDLIKKEQEIVEE